MKGRYCVKTEADFDWKEFQLHMGYSDEDLERLKSDPIKSKYVKAGATEAWNKLWVIAEVVESYGCESGLQVGDRLYFSAGGSVFEPTYSSRWCVHIMGIISNNVRGFRNLYTNGGDPTKLYLMYGACPDNRQFGLGRVMYQLYFVPEEDVHNPKLHRPAPGGTYYIED